MSFSLKLVDGDLSPKGSTLEVVFGVEKLKQDLDIWLREHYGIDRFHPNTGSTLQEYIGGIVTEETREEIQDEVLRVLQNYHELQKRILLSNPTMLSTSEMIASIEEISTTVSYDSVFVRIRIRNVDNNVQTITAGVSV